MPRVKRQPARLLKAGGSSSKSASMVEIEDEIERWNGVKTAHQLLNDMQVAKILVDCYDLIGANALSWTNKEPPKSDEVLELVKQKTDEGTQTLQEIRQLIVMPPEKEKDVEEKEEVVSPSRKSKRNVPKVQYIKEEPDQESTDSFVSVSLQEAVEESNADLADTGADVAETGEDATYAPEVEPDSAGDDDDVPADDDPSSDWEAENSKTEKSKEEKPKAEADSQPKPPTARKRGRPRKGEERPKAEPKPKKPREPKQPKVKKEKVPKEPKKPRVKEANQPVMPGYVIYECKQCTIRINKSKDEFKEHFASHGEEAVSAATAPEGKFDFAAAAKLFFYCIKCDLITHNRQSHFSVRHSVVKEKTRVCDICGLSCETLSKWRYHKQSHITSNKRFLCPICTKSFLKKPLLQAHIKRHSNKRNHVCDLCGKVLKTKETLRRHKHTHSNMKPLSCSVCGKGFTNNYNLNCHVRSHTGEKPYHCDMCPSAFAHRVSFRSHKKTVHGVNIIDTQFLIDEYDDEVVKNNKGKVIEVEHDPDAVTDKTAAAAQFVQETPEPQGTITIEVTKSQETVGATTETTTNVVVENVSSKLEEEVVQTLTREFPSIGVISGGQEGQPASSYVMPVNLTEPGSHSFLVHVPAVEPTNQMQAANQQQATYQAL